LQQFLSRWQGTESPVLLDVAIMISRETIEAIVAEKLEEENLFIVDISISPKNTITIMLDGEKGVSIKSCVAISRLVESKLDRNVEDYGLEVTSAGLGQPFRVVRQYSINIGREVEVLLLDGNKFKGVIVEAGSDNFSIEYSEKVLMDDGKHKQVVQQRKSFPYNVVKSTKAVISFK